MKTLFLLLSAIGLFFASCTYLQKNYKGIPWENKSQVIPGRIQCELYDIGGEGIAYHDIDSINNGSGKLNPANGDFFNEFRIYEGVDISYTKTNGIDNNPYNDVDPQLNQLYIGWTMPGEWVNYTADVKESGVYKIGLMYTSNGNGVIEILNGNYSSTGVLHVISTHKEADTVAWRQWHHWNSIDSLGIIKLNKGRQVLTLKTVENGNMNYDYLEFTQVQ